MKSSHSLDRLGVTFDDHRLAANAGRLLPATLAPHLSTDQLFESMSTLGEHYVAANAGQKAMTMVASALAGGACVNVDALRAGGTGAVPGHRVVAPSTLGTCLRAFTWGHWLQVEKDLAEVLKRTPESGAGPGLKGSRPPANGSWLNPGWSSLGAAPLTERSILGSWLHSVRQG